jgi:hypothetical protein
MSGRLWDVWRLVSQKPWEEMLRQKSLAKIVAKSADEERIMEGTRLSSLIMIICYVRSRDCDTAVDGRDNIARAIFIARAKGHQIIWVT